MFSGSLWQSTDFPKVKVTSDKVTETLEMPGIDFFNLDKYKASRNSRDRSKVATASVE